MTTGRINQVSLLGSFPSLFRVEGSQTRQRKLGKGKKKAEASSFPKSQISLVLNKGNKKLPHEKSGKGKIHTRLLWFS